jgi:hypothetical protein
MTQQEFKVGHKVFDILFGWGKVVGIHELEIYGVMVRFEKTTLAFTFEGKYLHNSITPTLSHTEYRLTSEPAFPRMMEVSVCRANWLERKVLFIRDGKAATYFEDIGYVEYDYYREIEPKTKLTLAQIAEKFGIERDKIEVVE